MASTIEQDREVIWAELPTLYFLPLSKGRFVVIDGEDRHLSRHKWSFDDCYAFRKDGKKSVMLHLCVFTPDAGKLADHINRIKLDCRRKNLRSASHTQNAMNTSGRSRTGFKGIGKTKYGYAAFTRIGGRRCYLGFRSTAVAAAELYDLHALKNHGDYAFLNFPEKKPQYLAALSRESAA